VQVYSVTNLFNETVRKCFFMAAALIFGVTTVHAQSSTNPTVYARLLTASNNGIPVSTNNQNQPVFCLYNLTTTIPAPHNTQGGTSHKAPTYEMAMPVNGGLLCPGTYSVSATCNVNTCNCSGDECGWGINLSGPGGINTSQNGCTTDSCTTYNCIPENDGGGDINIWTATQANVTVNTAFNAVTTVYTNIECGNAVWCTVSFSRTGA
jgi:hypothetical protein